MQNPVKPSTFTENTLITKSIFTSAVVKFATVFYGKESYKSSAASVDYCIFNHAYDITTVITTLLQPNWTHTLGKLLSINSFSSLLLCTEKN